MHALLSPDCQSGVFYDLIVLRGKILIHRQLQPKDHATINCNYSAMRGKFLNFRCLWGQSPHKHLKFSRYPLLAE